METGGSARLTDAVEGWWTELAGPDAIRAEDLDELCDHFRSLVEAEARAGVSIGQAADRARCRMGAPARLGEEFARVSTAPRVFRRWSARLAAYGLLHAVAVVALTAALAVAANARPDVRLAAAPGSLRFTGLAVLLAAAAVAFLIRGLGRPPAANRLRRAAAAVLASAAIAVLGLSLMLSVVFADYWSWWLGAHTPIGLDPWGAAGWLLLIGAGLPALAVTGALALRGKADRLSPSSRSA
ncbi:MAG: hypothetical protein ABFS46_06980 [Myxococcota bacterium]